MRWRCPAMARPGSWPSRRWRMFAFFTRAAGLTGHPYWTMTGAAHLMNRINFYKNVSLMGGFFLLYVTGAGKYSVDTRRSEDRRVGKEGDSQCRSRGSTDT